MAVLQRRGDRRDDARGDSHQRADRSSPTAAGGRRIATRPGDGEAARAARFDDRAAPPLAALAAIADAIGALAGIHRDQRWLEVGPGTGATSGTLVRRGVRYVGIDRSPAMLDVFRERLRSVRGVSLLIVADARARWPVRDGCIDVVFSARAIHRIGASHVVEEAVRVTRESDGVVLLGRVDRSAESVQSEMREKMRSLLGERGLEGLDHQAAVEDVLGELEARGWQRLGPLRTASWKRTRTAAQSLRAWTLHRDLAGLSLDELSVSEILGELRAWASARYGDLDRPRHQEEWYEVSGAIRGAVGREALARGIRT